MTAKIKLTTYLPPETLVEVEAEAERLDRSVSYLLDLAWKLAKSTIANAPALPSELESRNEDRDR